ncbi:protein kinase domain-containing protein [Haloferula sp.]|uniref:serine/threonine protein kinase n=1 Tax=Haloferula sp. TaxID=2497595 RepID=UPI0032A119FA
MTEASSTCPDCGTALPEDSPQHLCPSCLLKQAFASRTVDQGPDQTPPPSPEEIAEKFPQFEITECLGRGGMGVVYKARQKSLNRWVAIKVLAPERVDDEKFAERFSREAQTLAQLNHPNIVTVHDYGETGGLYFIVMEFVDGVNLRDLLQDGKIESGQALTIVPPICEALQYAHEKGIVHRDIKPENLLIDREGRVKIADFGIASLVGAAGEESGTPPYMAPEQTAHTKVDHRADIYALGAVLYEMLTGERPASPLDLPSQKVQVDIRIDDIVLRALSKEPERRYRTANEFQSVVETVVEKRAFANPPTIPTAPSAAPTADPVNQARGNRILPIIAVILAALITVAAIPLGLLWFIAPQKVDNTVPFHKVGFHVSHPDVISGNSSITRNVRQGHETDWSPSTGQELTLKGQDSIFFRCKVIAETSGASRAFFETSIDRQTWDREARVLNPSATVSITLSNGITCKISNKLGPNPEPKSPALGIGPIVVIGVPLVLLLAAIIWVVKSTRPRNESEQTSASTTKRSMFRRWWWLFLIMVPVSPLLGIAIGLYFQALMPKNYEASTTIQITPKEITLEPSYNTEQYIDAFISDESLEKLIKKHNLSHRRKLSMPEAVELLRNAITIVPIRGTDLLEIRVRWTNDAEVAGIANGLAKIHTDESLPYDVMVHALATRPRTPVSSSRKIMLIGAPVGLLLSPLLALGLAALLHRLFPQNQPRPTDPQNRLLYRNLAIGLFLVGILGTLAMMTLSHRHDMALIFGAVALFLSFVCGLKSAYSKVIKVLAVIIVILGVLSFIAAALIWSYRSTEFQSLALAEAEKAQQLEAVANSKRKEAEQSGLRFGPTIIREVTAPISSRQACFLDLDTSRLIDVPAEIYPLVKHRFNAAVSKPIDVDQKIGVWARDTGADLVISMTEPATHLALYGSNTIASTSAFEETTPADTIQRVAEKPSAESRGKIPAPFISFSSPNSHDSEAIVFRTREGAIGVLTVLGTSESPKRVKVAFKLVFDSKGPVQLPSREHEHVAVDFLIAVRNLDVESAHSLMLESAYDGLFPEPSEEDRTGLLNDFKEMNQAYSANPDLMLTINEWHANGGYRICRISPPKDGDGRSPYLVLALSPKGWRINDINDIRSDEILSEKLDEWLEQN